jgi:PAS domain S-box-containing protein
MNTNPSHETHEPAHARAAEDYRLAVESAGEYGILTLDLAGHFTQWSAGAERILGWQETEALGRHSSMIFTPEDVQRGAPEQEMETARAAGKAVDERWHLRKGGERFWGSGFMFLVRDDAGVSRGFVKIIQDETGRKATEEALRRQSELLNLAYDAIFVHRMDNRLIFWNRAAEELYGWSSDEALGQPCVELLQSDFPEPHEELVKKILSDGRWEGEVLHTRRDGKQLRILSRWALQRGENGEPVAILEVSHDVTSRRDAEEENARLYREMQREVQERRQREDEIRQLNERLHRAMTETHHRVKNSLQIVAAMLDMHAMEGAETVPMREIHRLAAQVRTMAAVHDLLTMEARGGAHADHVSARAVLERLIPLVSSTLADRELRADLDDATLSARQATSLALIANEAISNAVKHGVGVVELGFRREDGLAVLDVCDDGAGFPPGFDPVRSANVGLELMENLSQWDLAGTVEYTTRPGGGGRVIIRFPVGDAHATGTGPNG